MLLQNLSGIVKCDSHRKVIKVRNVRKVGNTKKNSTKLFIRIAPKCFINEGRQKSLGQDSDDDGDSELMIDHRYLSQTVADAH